MTDEELSSRIAALEEELAALKAVTDEEDPSPGHDRPNDSRRDFLKLVGGGTLGLGALGLIPTVSALTLRSPNTVRFFGGGSNNFTVKNNGAISGTITGDQDITNLAGDNLEIDGNGNLCVTPRIVVQSTAPSNPSEGDLWIDTS